MNIESYAKRGSLLLLPLLLGCPDNFGNDSGSTTTTTVTVTLQAPTNVQGAIQTGAEILWTWNDVNAVEEGYRIEIDDTFPIRRVNPAFWMELPANTTSFLWTGGAPNTTYFCQVYAIHLSLALESPASTQAMVTTPNVLPAPFVTSSLTGPTQVTLNWIDLIGETSYTVERSLDGGTTWTNLITGLAAGTISYVDNAAEGTEYCYRVRGVNIDGPGTPSTPVCELTLTQTGITATTFTGIFGEAAIAVEPGGTEHIAHLNFGPFGADTDVDHTTFVLPAGPPVSETADSGPTGTDDIGTGPSGTSLALDASARAYFAHYDGDNLELRYATNASGTMIASTLAFSGPGETNGEMTAVAVSPLNGTVHILFKRVTFNPNPFQGFLRHAWNSGTGWSFEDVYTTPVNDRIEGLAIDVDNAGTVHVGFYEVTNAGAVTTLRYTQKPNAGSWAAPTMIAQTSGIRDFDLAADGSGFAHVSLENSELMHGTNVSGSWVFETVADSPISLGWDNSITVNRATGRIHIAHTPLFIDQLHYARKDPSGVWVRKLLDMNADGRTDIDVDGSGNPHIVFRTAGTNEVRRLTGSP